MLFAAGMPKTTFSVLNTYSAETGLTIDYGRELGVDRLMIGAAGARIREALDRRQAMCPWRKPCFVGRGSSDPDANSNVAKVTRMLVEGFGFGWGETVYSGVTFRWSSRAPSCGAPWIPPDRGVPLLPFSGVLVMIRQHTDLWLPIIPMWTLCRPPISAITLVLDTFVERVEEVLGGETAMNCSSVSTEPRCSALRMRLGLRRKATITMWRA